MTQYCVDTSVRRAVSSLDYSACRSRIGAMQMGEHRNSVFRASSKLLFPTFRHVNVGRQLCGSVSSGFVDLVLSEIASMFEVCPAEVCLSKVKKLGWLFVTSISSTQIAQSAFASLGTTVSAESERVTEHSYRALP